MSESSSRPLRHRWGGWAIRGSSRRHAPSCVRSRRVTSLGRRWGSTAVPYLVSIRIPSVTIKFAERMSRLGTESAFEVLAKARRLESEGKRIVHLEIGEPDFATPDNIVEAGISPMQDGHTPYTPAAWIFEAPDGVPGLPAPPS